MGLRVRLKWRTLVRRKEARVKAETEMSWYGGEVSVVFLQNRQ